MKKIQEMMIQTEKMISVGGIAAGIAHEINNPLGIIMQAAQNLVQRTRADFPKNLQVAQDIGLDMDKLARYMTCRELDNFIEDIQVAARRASEIIRHMLDFSRQSASERAFCHPGTLVEKALSLARNDYDLKKCYDFKKVQIEIDMEDALPGIFCGETEIEQVLLNLFRNAAQAMAGAPHPVESPRIAIRVGKHAGRVRIEVQDNGPGMPAEVRRRVFEPFFTTKPPGRARGLGLSVSYFIITQGHGAPFPSPRHPERGPPSSWSSQPPLPGGTDMNAPLPRVIIVDDESGCAAFWSSISRITKSSGSKRPTRGGGPGTPLRRAGRLCIVDIRLPGMDGAAFIKEARSGAVRPVPGAHRFA
jgi:C4-dicarboxylate-specific signal transduction histidine kinase